MRTIFIWHRVGFIGERLWTSKARNWLTVYGTFFTTFRLFFPTMASIVHYRVLETRQYIFYVFILYKLYLISAQKHCTKTNILSIFKNILLNMSCTRSWAFTAFLGSPKHILDLRRHVILSYVIIKQTLYSILSRKRDSESS
jgi:hypothetical protein